MNSMCENGRKREATKAGMTGSSRLVPTNRAKATIAKLQSAAVAVRLGDVPNISVATRDLSRPSLRVVVLVLDVHRQSLDAQSRDLIVGDLEVDAT